MALTATLGSIGDEVNLLISKGDDFGPHQLTLTNPDASPVNLTGATITAKLKKGTAVAVAFTTEITNAVGGAFTFSLPAAITATLASGEGINDHASVYQWDLRLTDSTGKKRTLFYGQARVKATVA